jgi:hypothetical protein
MATRWLLTPHHRPSQMARKPNVCGHLGSAQHNRAHVPDMSPDRAQVPCMAGGISASERACVCRVEHAPQWYAKYGHEARRDAVPGMVRTGATFADAAAECLRWVAEDRGRDAPTVEEYRSIINVHLRPAFGSTRLEDVTVSAVEAFRAELARRFGVAPRGQHPAPVVTASHGHQARLSARHDSGRSPAAVSTRRCALRPPRGAPMPDVAAACKPDRNSKACCWREEQVDRRPVPFAQPKRESCFWASGQDCRCACASTRCRTKTTCRRDATWARRERGCGRVPRRRAVFARRLPGG